MNHAQDIDVRVADWDADEAEIYRIRHAVFVIEQAVDPALEWDGEDAGCAHALAFDAAGRAVATGRLAPDGKIGRMAVLAETRGQGYGAAILARLVDEAGRLGLASVYLHAQTHALPFYARHGFVAYGPEFDEAGIPHRAMRRGL